MGDLLVLTVGPLVLRKAYGQIAGITAVGVGLATIGAIAGAADAGWLQGTFPTMIMLGPLLIAQVAWWGRRRGAARTMAEYLAARPLPLAENSHSRERDIARD